MAKRRMYSFAEKKHSQKGIFSTILSGVSFLLLCILIYIAFWAGGDGEAWMGAIGLTAIALAGEGLIAGLLSFKDRDVFYFFSKTGSILSGIMLAVWIFIILIGVQ